MVENGLQMRQSAIELLILKTLSWGPQHGYSIARWIQDTTDDVLQIEEGSLYPALRRLAERRLVRSAWGVSENNRRAKFYDLTSAGRAQLRRETPTWLRHADAIATALRASTPKVLPSRA